MPPEDVNLIRSKEPKGADVTPPLKPLNEKTKNPAIKTVRSAVTALMLITSAGSDMPKPPNWDTPANNYRPPYASGSI